MSFTPEQQEKIQKLQQVQNNFEQMRNHRMQLERRQTELKTTLSAIEDLADEKEVYKSVGQLLLTTKVGEARTEMQEELEKLEAQLINVKSREKSLEEQLVEGQKKLRAQMGQMGQ